MHTILEFSHGKNTNCFFILNAFILKILNWSGGHGLASVNTITWNFHIIFVYSSRMFLIPHHFSFYSLWSPFTIKQDYFKVLYPGVFHVKFGWKWSYSSGEDYENVKVHNVMYRYWDFLYKKAHLFIRLRLAKKF